MGTLSLWFVLVSMVPRCYDIKLAEYMTCEATQRANTKFKLECTKPLEILAASFFVGKPAIDIEGDPSCLEVTVAEVAKLKFKKYSMEEWNKISEVKSVGIRPIK